MAGVAASVVLIVLLALLACLSGYRRWRSTRKPQQKSSDAGASTPLGVSHRILLFGPDGAIESLLRLEGERMALGRSSENDFSYPDNTLSRRHLVFEKDAEGWWIRDLGSRNGTLVNGLCLGTKHLLRPGDQIAAGQLRMVYRSEALFLSTGEDGAGPRDQGFATGRFLSGGRDDDVNPRPLAASLHDQ
ncbi:MAG: FHA domain-containing protein [Bryobacterales bacterium]|nr:FHA domain-containing protein [Bryobacterales bacterium]